MSEDVGTTPIIADLKGRRVLVTGKGSENLICHAVLQNSLNFGPHCLKSRQLWSHADGLRHYATHVEGFSAHSCTSEVYRHCVCTHAGGSAGIGKATALAFDKNGCKVAVLGRRKERLDAVVSLQLH